MTELMKVGATQNANETMTSLQISEVTGKEHSNVLRDIRVIVEKLTENVSEEGGFKFELTQYKDTQGKLRPMYQLSKKDCLLLASGYDIALRAKIINRWEKLEIEKQHQFDIPTTLSGALMLAAKQAEQIEQQQKQLTEQAPKVDFYEAVTGSNDTVDMATVAKVLNLGIGRNNLFELLRNKGILSSKNAPMQRYVDNGWFRQIESTYNKPDGSTCINIKTVVFQKGIESIRKIVLQHLDK